MPGHMSKYVSFASIYIYIYIHVRKYEDMSAYVSGYMSACFYLERVGLTRSTFNSHFVINFFEVKLVYLRILIFAK